MAQKRKPGKPASGDELVGLKALEDVLPELMHQDEQQLRRRVAGLQRRFSKQGFEKVREAVSAAEQRMQTRLAQSPVIEWPDLPVVASLDQLSEKLLDHQVIVVAGETGSGKTTQLPKLCLSLGRGRRGLIGHTQPRRLAARTVAARLAEELHASVGQMVGYKIRFQDRTADETLIKLMTDGILLAEIQQDPWLDQYDTLIIDEAHERSLNIDFLLGYLHRLLPRRPDLKVIITSATIDHERFSRHFDDAPVVEVSGRTFPVEVRYRPVMDGEQDINRDIENILGEIETEERGQGAVARDVLVFLSGEREIRDLHHHLKRCDFRDCEFLPLYSRLGQQEQNRVFMSHKGRRVVLSTNVAETSLTVPGIRYVIDTGTARISRYSVQTKVQRLPVEPISRASANQRMGRCGRVMPGICYRLYGEEDYLSRVEFTDPEIRRTNLAAVILQMAELGLGDVADFPFIDPPDGSRIRDGYRLLEELGALHERKMTDTGRQLARLPVDPRLGRMLLEASQRLCLRETLIIVAALGAQDPRERPHDKQQQADQAHQPFNDPASDFVFFINLWQWAEQQRENLSRNQYEKILKKHFLSPLRMREWRETHHQLLVQCRSLSLSLNQQPAGQEDLHRSLLSGLLGHVIKRTDEGEWLSTRNRKPVIWPGSALRKTKSRWLMAAELVDTGRLFARCVARVEPEWIEEAAGHLVKRRHYEPRWSKKRGAVMAREEVTLYGLPLVSGRRVNYGPIEPELCRELMIREGLVAGELAIEPSFVKANKALYQKLEDIEHKLRRRDILADEQVQFDFYDQRLPDDVYSLRHLMSWYKQKASQQQQQALLMTEELLLPQSPDAAIDDYPDELLLDTLRLPLTYSFQPDGTADGVTLSIPVEVINQISKTQLQWLVPGMLREKIDGLIRALPKKRRRNFVPVPNYVDALMECLQPGAEPLLPAMTRELQRMTGMRVEHEEWDESSLSDYLRFNLCAYDGKQLLAESRDLDHLQKAFAGRATSAVQSQDEDEVISATDWQFDTVPVTHEQQRGNYHVQVWPALEDRHDEVAMVYYESEAEACWQHAQGVARLTLLRLPTQTRTLKRKLKTLPGFQKVISSKNALDKQLLDDALIEVTLNHFSPDMTIRDQQEFTHCLDNHRSGFVDQAEKRLQQHSEMLAAWQSLQQKLDKNFPLAWAHAHRDLKAWLSLLVYPGFFREMPSQWLSEYSRYLRAAEHRLEKLGGQLPDDKEKARELEVFYEQYIRRKANMPFWALSEPLQQWRWMLEEYRVSLFAQHLGTRMPVSAKRLKKHWEGC